MALWTNDCIPHLPTLTPQVIFGVERAHRVLAQPSSLAAQQRPLLARFSICKDRHLVLRKARHKGTVSLSTLLVGLAKADGLFCRSEMKNL